VNRIFGCKRDGEWRRLHNEELHALYSSSNIIWVFKSRRIKWAGHVAYTGNRKHACTVSAGKPEKRRPFGEARRSWENEIKMDLNAVGWGGGLNWIDVTHDRDM
jgi:hypothetical protein